MNLEKIIQDQKIEIRKHKKFIATLKNELSRLVRNRSRRNNSEIPNLIGFAVSETN